LNIDIIAKEMEFKLLEKEFSPDETSEA